MVFLLIYIGDNYERLILSEEDFISIVKCLYSDYDEMKKVLDERFVDNAVRCSSKSEISFLIV